MKTERTVRFKMIRNGQVKELRGILFLEENREPTLEDFAACLKSCGHEVKLLDNEQAIFRAESTEGGYLIDVLEDYKAPSSRDPQAETLAKQYLNEKSR